MSSVWLTVEISPGTSIEQACKDAVEMANAIRVCIWFSFSGVRCLARAGDDPAKLAESWEQALKSNGQYKVASAK